MITPADLKRLLTYPITFHRVFSEVGGGVTAGLLLSQLFYLATEHADDEGWFYHAGKVLMDETTLTRTEFDNARKKLKDKGILYEDLRGVPAQLHWRIDFDCLANLIDGFPQTEVQKRRNPDRRKPAIKDDGKPQTLTDHVTDQNTSENDGDLWVNKQIQQRRAALSRLVGKFDGDSLYWHFSKDGVPPATVLAALEDAIFQAKKKAAR